MAESRPNKKVLDDEEKKARKKQKKLKKSGVVDEQQPERTKQKSVAMNSIDAAFATTARHPCASFGLLIPPSFPNPISEFHARNAAPDRARPQAKERAAAIDAAFASSQAKSRSR